MAAKKQSPTGLPMPQPAACNMQAASGSIRQASITEVTVFTNSLASWPQAPLLRRRAPGAPAQVAAAHNIPAVGVPIGQNNISELTTVGGKKFATTSTACRHADNKILQQLAGVRGTGDGKKFATKRKCFW